MQTAKVKTATSPQLLIQVKTSSPEEGARHQLQFIVDEGLADKDSHPSLRIDKARLIQASLSSGTWAKYKAGWNMLVKFELATGRKYKWPLKKSVLRDFEVFYICKKNLKAAAQATQP